MKLIEYVRLHQEEIDRYILETCPGTPIDDIERELWIYEIDLLYDRASEAGAEV